MPRPKPRNRNINRTGGRPGAFLALVCGSTTITADDRVHVPIGDSEIIVAPISGHGQTGLRCVAISTADNEETVRELDGLQATTGPGDTPSPAQDTGVILDHVAVLVADLEHSSNQWEAATGVSAEQIGIHPVSAGSFRAARLDVGDQMLELVSPVAGVESGLASRPERYGEGAVTLAIPAKDLDATRRTFEEADVRLVWQDPHWFVHPVNPANTLIQLTPRVQH